FSGFIDHVEAIAIAFFLFLSDNLSFLSLDTLAHFSSTFFAIHLLFHLFFHGLFRCHFHIAVHHFHFLLLFLGPRVLWLGLGRWCLRIHHLLIFFLLFVGVITQLIF